MYYSYRGITDFGGDLINPESKTITLFYRSTTKLHTVSFTDSDLKLTVISTEIDQAKFY